MTDGTPGLRSEFYFVIYKKISKFNLLRVSDTLRRGGGGKNRRVSYLCGEVLSRVKGMSGGNGLFGGWG